MKIKVELKHLRIAPRKVRLVADLVRGKRVDKAQAILKFTIKRGADKILKLLNSAIANAKNSFELDSANLYISKITVDGGPMLKRWRARSRGMAARIEKRTSHITLVLDEITPSEKIKKVEKKVEEVIEKPVSVKATADKPKLRPVIEKPKPKEVKGLKRFFRRKSV